MSQQGLEAALCKMREAGVDGSAIGVFSHYYRLLESGETGLIREESIEPLLDPPMLDENRQKSDSKRKMLIFKHVFNFKLYINKKLSLSYHIVLPQRHTPTTEAHS